MRLLIAMMKHETNTFSPVPTPLERFRPLYGEAAIRAFRGTGTGLGAYLDLAAREGAEIVLPIAAGSSPSRPVDDAAYAHIAETIPAGFGSCTCRRRPKVSDVYCFDAPVGSAAVTTLPWYE